ncbi:MAG: hypothetical protein V5B30_22830 [Candidatus Accumulibacter delftensis]
MTAPPAAWLGGGLAPPGFPTMNLAHLLARAERHVVHESGSFDPREIVALSQHCRRTTTARP